MRKIKWKILIITCLICILPILGGVALWDRLPDVMAIHFDLNNNPDNFASKTFVVFGLPALMACFQIFGCVTTDLSINNRGKAEFTKWIIPVVTILLYALTLAYGMGYNIDMRVCGMIIVSFMFILTGIFLPKLDYIKNYPISPQKAKKINRFAGKLSIVMGILGLLSIFFSPMYATGVWLWLFVPYTAAVFVYGYKVCKSE